MNETMDNRTQQSIEDPLSPLKLLNRLVSLIFIIVIVYVLFSLAYGVIFVLGAFGLTHLQVDPNISIVSFQNIFTSVWNLIIPIITLVIIGMLIKWVFFSPQGRERTTQVTQILTDLPSVIAIVVITTVCILALLRTDNIPEPLGNIALVIIGFYFGRLRRNHTTEEIEIKKDQE
jgi:hypothetical protein